jgi:hypothetical protein
VLVNGGVKWEDTDGVCVGNASKNGVVYTCVDATEGNDEVVDGYGVVEVTVDG